MLDPFLSCGLVAKACSGNFESLHEDYPVFIKKLYEYCSQPIAYSAKHFALTSLETLLKMLAEQHASICTRCKEQFDHLGKLIRHVRDTVLKDDNAPSETHAPPGIEVAPITCMKWPGTRIEFCENIYSDYALGLNERADGTQMTLAEMLENHNYIYGMDVTYDELTNGPSKFKERKGSGYPDYRDGLPVRGYLTFKRHQALEDFFIQQEDKDGRSMKPPRFKKDKRSK